MKLIRTFDRDDERSLSLVIMLQHRLRSGGFYPVLSGSMRTGYSVEVPDAQLEAVENYLAARERDLAQPVGTIQESANA